MQPAGIPGDDKNGESDNYGKYLDQAMKEKVALKGGEVESSEDKNTQKPGQKLAVLGRKV